MKLNNYERIQISGKLIMEAGILLMIADILCAIGIWQAIVNGWKVAEGGTLFFEAFIRTREPMFINAITPRNCYVLFLSVVFSFMGNREEMVLWANLFLKLAGVFFFYRGSRKLFGYLPGILTAVAAGIISGAYFAIVQDTPMHLVLCTAAIAYWLTASLLHSVIGFIGERKCRRKNADNGEEIMKEAKLITETVSEPEDVKMAETAEIRTSVKFIENPLPVPKKHVKKEMTYAFEPTPDKMHYDLNNYRADDDYDLKNIE